MSRQPRSLESDVLLWALPTFVLNLAINGGDVVQAALVAAVVTAVGVPLERRLTRD